MHACGREIHVTGFVEADIREPAREGMGGHRRPRRVSDDAEWGGGTFLHVCNASRLIYIRKKKKKKKKNLLSPVINNINKGEDVFLCLSSVA
jgi:hypothetical protein